MFLKTVKLFFSSKGPMKQKIALIENDEIIDKIDNFFSSIVSKLNIPKYKDLSVNSVNSEDPLKNLVTKYKNHPSIRAILDKSPNRSFSLKTVSKKDIEKETLNLNVAKVYQDSNIPSKIIKKNSDIFSDILFKEFNKSLEICKFPSCLKMANVTPVNKKGNRSDKENCRRVSILPNLSKIFERCLCKQISTYFEDIYSKYQSVLIKSVGLPSTFFVYCKTRGLWF